MNPARVIGLMVVCVAVSGPAAADVTFKQKISGKGMVAAVASGDSTQIIKGARMRTDQAIGGNETSTIIDANAQQMIVLNHKRREAEVYDMTKIATDLAKIPISDVKASVTPTKETRQIAGSTCTVHQMEVTVPTVMGSEKLTFVMSGPVCMAKNGPGHSDFAVFYKTAAEKGLFFGDPRAAKAQGAQAKGMTELYRQMASLGVPLAQEMNIKFEGGGAMGAMMAKMGANTMTTEVVSISTAAIPDTTFDVPAGYTIVKR
jgi:hypothetical protein